MTTGDPPGVTNVDPRTAVAYWAAVRALTERGRFGIRLGLGRTRALLRELGHPERPVLDMFLRFATSEDGALHAEKYFRTVSEEFAAARPAFRWRQLVALSRVTASEFGRPAPGYAEACEILKV